MAAIIELRVDDFNGEIAVHGVAVIVFATLAARSLENGEVAVRVLCFEACKQAHSDLPCELRAQKGARNGEIAVDLLPKDASGRLTAKSPCEGCRCVVL